jgi:hypothetical protein
LQNSFTLRKHQLFDEARVKVELARKKGSKRSLLIGTDKNYL